MKKSITMYKRHRFPPENIQYSVWLYHRFTLSHRDVEDMLAERGMTVSYESIRLWCIKFGSKFARRLKKKHQGYGDTFFMIHRNMPTTGQNFLISQREFENGSCVDSNRCNKLSDF